MAITVGSTEDIMLNWPLHPLENEDCLMLNVWTPALKDNGKRTVMVWFHGGGFTQGSGAHSWYDGRALCHRGNVVVVTVNHRLGPLGYLYLGDLGGAAYAQSGNAGMLDCVAALQWIHDNIETFGGDPNSVMIFGQSGGGAKVSTMLGMPAAKGLFHRGVIESGARLRATPRDLASKTAELFLAELGLDKSKLAQLQALPFEKIVAAQKTFATKHPPAGWGPVLDGSVITQHPFDPVANPLSADIPVMVGSVHDEPTLGYSTNQKMFSLDDAGLQQNVKELLGDAAAGPALAEYRRVYPKATPIALFIQISADHGARMNSITLAERKAALHKAPVYMYYVTFPAAAFGGKLGATHAVEVPLIFDNVPFAPMMSGTSPEAHALATKMSSTWLAFAKTGNPNTKEIPQWPAYSADARATMIFDKDCRVENDPAKELRMFWQQLKTRRHPESQRRDNFASLFETPGDRS